MGKDGKVDFFVFIDTGYGDVHKVRESLLTVDEIEVVHCLLGPTDIICYATADSLEHMTDIVENKIQVLMDEPHNGIRHSETMLSIGKCGNEITREANGDPEKVAAWVLADVNVSDSDVINSFMRNSTDIVSIHNVIGRFDTIMYVESESTKKLMETIDDGVRRLRTFSRRGTDKALTRTDTRLVLM